MKRLFYAAGLFTALASTIYPYGQTLVAQADVPFGFQMGQTFMPAGKYIVSESGALLTVRGEAGKPAAMILTIPESRTGKASHPSLQFQRYGGEYFLTKVWNGDSRGHGLPKAKREKELARRATFGQTEEVALRTNSH